MNGVKEVGLLGVRLGGTLAMLAAQSEPVIKYVVVWVPILNPKIYFQGILRRQIYSAMLNMEEKKSLKDLYSELKLGGKVDIGGYYLSDKAYNAFCEIDFSELLKQARQPVHIGLLERETTNTDKIVLDKIRDTIESPLDVTMVPDEPFWNFIMQKDISPPVRLMEETLKWLYNAEYLSGIACGSID
jgi:hypothetical protein